MEAAATLSNNVGKRAACEALDVPRSIFYRTMNSAEIQQKKERPAPPLALSLSRPLRIEYPNAWHHVMNRSRRGRELFIGKDDYECFLDLLQETSGMFNIKIASCCLMPTHYHLLVHTPETNLSRCMRHLNSVKNSFMQPSAVQRTNLEMWQYF